MRVFVAGASGAIGTPLVRQLLAGGHEVTGMTRREERAEAIRATGADAVVCDAFDAEGLARAVKSATPDAVINQLTSLPRKYNPRKAAFYEATNRVRHEGGHNLIEATRAAGASRFVTQSIAFLYAPEGDWVKDEEARPFDDAPGHFGGAVAAMLSHEREVVESPDFTGLVLRYGQFYGPGTYFGADGHIGREVSRRRFPIVGPGTGMFSFLHLEDAAGATLAALEHGPAGVYNVVDDEPARLGEWLPVYAEALGAKPPRKVPVWLAKLVAGGAVASTAVELRGASNARAKRELGWAPAHPSWRQGFRDSLT
jgi:nucleoside-diphosphate-sugar epimerase